MSEIVSLFIHMASMITVGIYDIVLKCCISLIGMKYENRYMERNFAD